MKKLRPPANRPSPFSAASGPRRLVLCVEDDPDNRQVVSARLSKTYELVFAVDDREACEALKARGSKLEIILMDVELQGSRLNGIELTRLIRGKRDSGLLPDYAEDVPQLDTPILFVTAYSQRYRQGELQTAGADGTIQKPVDFVELHTAMTRAYLARAQAKP